MFITIMPVMKLVKDTKTLWHRLFSSNRSVNLQILRANEVHMSRPEESACHCTFSENEIIHTFEWLLNILEKKIIVALH